MSTQPQESPFDFALADKPEPIAPGDETPPPESPATDAA